MTTIIKESHIHKCEDKHTPQQTREQWTHLGRRRSFLKQMISPSSMTAVRM